MITHEHDLGILVEYPTVTTDEPVRVRSYEITRGAISEVLDNLVIVGVPESATRYVCQIEQVFYNNTWIQGVAQEVIAQMVGKPWSEIQRDLNMGKRIFVTENEYNQIINAVIARARALSGVDAAGCKNRRFKVDQQVVASCPFTCEMTR